MKNLLLILICFLVSCKNEHEPSKVKDTVIEKETIEAPIEKSKPLKEESGKSVAELKAELISKGYKVFDYVDEKTQDTTLMQQYFMA